MMKWIYRQNDKKIDGQNNRKHDRQKDRQIEQQKKRQIERKIDRHKEKSIEQQKERQIKRKKGRKNVGKIKCIIVRLQNFIRLPISRLSKNILYILIDIKNIHTK